MDKATKVLMAKTNYDKGGNLLKGEDSPLSVNEYGLAMTQLHEMGYEEDKAATPPDAIITLRSTNEDGSFSLYTLHKIDDLKEN